MIAIKGERDKLTTLVKSYTTFLVSDKNGKQKNQ